MVSWEFVSCVIALLAIFIALCVYVGNSYWNSYRYLAELYYNTLKMGVEHPEFLDPEKTQKYKEIWGPNSKNFFRYDAYAQMCWAHAEDIYATKFLKIIHFKKLYGPLFKRYYELHCVWLHDNASMFPMKGFIEFVESKKWAGYYIRDRTADQLRWDNECYDCDERILSPLSEGVKNPLFDYIDTLDKYTVVADFGCGTGRLVEILSKKKFKKVCGIDYSENMLRIARKRCESPNVEYKSMDITNLSELYEKIDIAFSINSILPRNPNDTPKMIQEIYKALKPGGLFIGILPSFDTVLYLKKLWLEDYFNKLENKRKAKLKSNFPYSMAHWFKKEKNKWKAELETYLEFRKRKLNKRKHLYADDFVNVQRFIHESEIKDLLVDDADFKILHKDKVIYPWEVCKKYNYEYFPGNDEIWDWFVVAKK